LHVASATRASRLHVASADVRARPRGRGPFERRSGTQSLSGPHLIGADLRGGDSTASSLVP
jgi:hypothetical protein